MAGEDSSSESIFTGRDFKASPAFEFPDPESESREFDAAAAAAAADAAAVFSEPQTKHGRLAFQACRRRTQKDLLHVW